MPYVIPAMPLDCDVWWNYDPTVTMYSAPDINKVKGCLSPGKRVMLSVPTPTSSPTFYEYPVELLLPPLTNISGETDVVFTSVVEVPTGSHRFYVVTYVDDIAKGFANEHRYILMNMFKVAMVFIDVTWPFPIPLP